MVIAASGEAVRKTGQRQRILEVLRGTKRHFIKHNKITVYMPQRPWDVLFDLGASIASQPKIQYFSSQNTGFTLFISHTIFSSF